METRVKIGIVILVIIVILLILFGLSRRKHHGQSESEKVRKEADRAREERPSKDLGFSADLGPKFRIKTIDAPVLRCYDYFEFPSQGGFHVKTCGSSPSGPTRLFVQWFPVKDARQYNVYLNKGPDVSTEFYKNRWEVPATSYFYETEELPGHDCWSLMVTAQDENGIEGLPSKIYSTCSL